MSEEISKGSLSVLMIMTLLISVLSTLTVLNAIDGAKEYKEPAIPITQDSGNFAGLEMEIYQKEYVNEDANIKLMIKR